MSIITLDHNGRSAIEWAYDNFEKEEFLERLYEYINTQISLTQQECRLEQAKYNNERRLDRK